MGSGCGDPTCAGSTDTPSNLERVVALAECDAEGTVALANNAYYTPANNATFVCYDSQVGPMSLADMQARYELELGSTHSPTPSFDVLLEWAAGMLRKQ